MKVCDLIDALESRPGNCGMLIVVETDCGQEVTVSLIDYVESRKSVCVLHASSEAHLSRRGK